MLIESGFRHPEATSAATVYRSPDVAALVNAARPAALDFHRAGETIYAEGDAAGPLYLVVSGAVRIVRLTPDGRRQISAFYFSGEVFGFEAGAEHRDYAESVDGAVLQVLRPIVGHGFGDCALKLALHSLERANHQLMLLGRMSAVERLASFLTDLMVRQDSDGLIDLPMQRNDIADHLGLTFETVSRVLRTLKEKKIIRLMRVDQIEILDLEGLQALGD